MVIEQHGTAGDDPGMFAEMNLRMLVLSGGPERSVDEYAALAAGAGLQVAAVHTTPLGEAVLECIPQSAQVAMVLGGQ